MDDNTISILLEREAKIYPAKNAETIVPDQSGFYSIFIDEPANFPTPFDSLLYQRNTNLIYIGTTSISLLERLVKQDLRGKKHSTFFRSIGCILGFRPQRGSLRSNKNEKNYKFSPKDKREIVTWINNHLSIRWVEIDTKSHPDAEKTAIQNLCPILNKNHNYNPSPELAIIRAECREIANAKHP